MAPTLLLPQSLVSRPFTQITNGSSSSPQSPESPENCPNTDKVVPRPLQIVKRAENSQHRNGDNTGPAIASRSSSNGTIESRGSAPDVAEGDQPLKVLKKRRLINRSSEICGSTPITIDDVLLEKVGAELENGNEQDDLDRTPRPIRQGLNRGETLKPAAAYTMPHKGGVFYLRRRRLLNDSSADEETPPRPSSAIQVTPESSRQTPFPTLVHRPSIVALANKQPCTPSDQAFAGTTRCRAPLTDAFPFPALPPLSRPTSTLPPEPSLLVPRIVVTPECKTLNEKACTLWAAVQVSAEICRPQASDHVMDSRMQGISRSSQASPDVFQYGCLYNVSLDMTPVVDSSILEMIEDETCSSTLYPGSRLLKLVHIKLASNTAHYSTRLGHVRQDSDDLMDDLEHQLGTSLVEFMHLRLSYQHSAFPQQSSVLQSNMASYSASNGTVGLKTTLSTSATGVIRRHNAASPWSPQPPTQPNPLFEIIASHWGAAAANDVMYRIMMSRSAAGVTSVSALDASQNTPSPPRMRSSIPRFVAGSAKGVDRNHRVSHLPAVPSPTRPAPPVPVPRRQASLGRVERRADDAATESLLPPSIHPPPGVLSATGNSMVEGKPDSSTEEDSSSSESSYTSRSDDCHNKDRETDPAHRIWNEMRRTSLGGGVHDTYHAVAVRKMASTLAMRAATPDTALNSPMPRVGAYTRNGAASVNSRLGCSKVWPEVEMQREALRERALRNMRSVGPDVLRQQHQGSDQQLQKGRDVAGNAGGRGAENSVDAAAGSRTGWRERGKEGKEHTVRWGWGGWWQ